MLGCAAFVTLWAVPTVLTTLAPFMFEIPEPFPVIKFELKIPETVRLVRVPTVVMLGWEGFVTLEAILATATFPIRFEEFRFEIPEPFPMIRLVTIEFRFEIPETFRLVRVPTDVMFSWEGFVTLEATLAAATFPTRFEALTFVNPEPFPLMKFVIIEFRFEIPETFRLVKIPTDVMLV
jgi:hypothetical protein